MRRFIKRAGPICRHATMEAWRSFRERQVSAFGSLASFASFCFKRPLSDDGYPIAIPPPHRPRCYLPPRQCRGADLSVPASRRPSPVPEFSRRQKAAEQPTTTSRARSPLLDQDLAPPHRIGGGDDALILHHLDDPRGLVVADREPALDIACRTSAIARDDGDGVVVKLGIRVACGCKAELLVDRRLRLLVDDLGHRHHIIRLPDLAEMIDDLLDLLIGDKGPVHAS